MSVSKQSQRRGTILDEIMTYHREQLPKTKRAVPIGDLRALVSVAPPAVSFSAALKQPGVSLIAECKKASPSKGLLLADYDPVRLAQTYVRAGARAISVLTDARHFQGSLEHLRDVKETMADLASLVHGKNDPRMATGVPVLRKDFLFDPYQLYEARAAGADAVLLIAAVLEGGELGGLIGLVNQLGMEALVEVHTEAELERVVPLNPTVIGVNNRDLQTFEVDFENTARLRAMIPAGVTVVAESGIKTAADVRRLAEIGVDAILVGETLVRSKDIGKTAAQLVAAGR
ncbi:MAG TPA: indole-3-glycerol phosphate synthase TrpC [Anaerolineae bacterium]|jgi:indole-3-glycerol phosphate synthase|nr:indole-3-glycerol phosphate synthase TrpC [Anaerolineae bacterium]